MIELNTELMLHILKFILVLGGFYFIYYLTRNKNIKDIYEKRGKESLQRKILLIVLSVLIVIVLIGFSSIFDKYLMGITDVSIIGIYFSSFVTSMVGGSGVVFIAFTLLYGSFYTAYLNITYKKAEKYERAVNIAKEDKRYIETEKKYKEILEYYIKELGRIKKQGLIWLCFAVYFDCFMFVMFILPLHIQLSFIAS
jgi:hypothetical protein